MIETFDDSDDVSQNSESQVYNLLNNLARLVHDEHQRTKRSNVAVGILEWRQLSTGQNHPNYERHLQEIG